MKRGFTSREESDDHFRKGEDNSDEVFHLYQGNAKWLEGETFAGVTSKPGVEYDLIAQEVESAEYRRRVSSTYTTRARTRGMVLHMLGGQEACTEGAMIHKAVVRRCGHKGAHKGAHQQVLMHA